MAELSEYIKVVARLVHGAQRKTVGFAVKNTGPAPIIKTLYSYDVTPTTRRELMHRYSIAPGETVCMTKNDFVRLMSEPEFSFEASNWIVYPIKCKETSKCRTTEKLLSSYAFRFTDARAAQEWLISTKINGKWEILDKFASVFGKDAL